MAVDLLLCLTMKEDIVWNQNIMQMINITYLIKDKKFKSPNQYWAVTIRVLTNTVTILLQMNKSYYQTHYY